ncbi:uncharacterized protein SETTUDRAFT_166567 [Exserohilum turcica Et28A]|uniref:Uncharacterized protein n=1 Tax=Exserohilum turcicum (strain 28A) TaxID=671987 RepID=R0KCH7_EXST2|nr:uncharacterized protein SETTUDRAFT_166567 [Exserohilum turcica Et28A]EOA90593.1 hypothetical protein SETTUDRAFT_166567 [Exserohilum turcica Et28A]
MIQLKMQTLVPDFDVLGRANPCRIVAKIWSTTMTKHFHFIIPNPVPGHPYESSTGRAGVGTWMMRATILKCAGKWSFET